MRQTKVQDITDKIKSVAMDSGADIVGIASIDAIPDSVPPLPVTKMMPSARSVVVFGIPMLRGSIESPSLHSAAISTHAAYKELERISYAVAKYLEKQGHRAAMVVPASPIEMSKETKGLLGDISLRHAAVGAGLGTIGKNRLLLTRKWGPRVRLGAVVTDALLSADKPLQDNLCDECDLCIQACPGQALNSNTLKDAVKCLSKQQIYGMAKHIQYWEKMVEAPIDRQKEMLRSPDYWNIYQAQSITLFYTCYECLNSCPLGSASAVE
jgi:epoxyqueuosine reductase